VDRRSYDRRTDTPSSDEVVRATKALILGLLLGAIMAFLGRSDRARR
jgi:hypothetical protein